MKEFIYLIFFGVINLFFFYLNTRKIDFNYKTRLLLILFLTTFIIFHFINWNKMSIPNHYFFQLIVVSFVSFVIHYAGEFTISLIKKVDIGIENGLAIKIFNFLRFYVIYFFIFFYQSVFLYVIHKK